MVALAAPLTAQAATEFGQTHPAPSQEDPHPSQLPTLCQSDLNLVQVATGADPRYTAPHDGVIVSWSHRGATLAEGSAGQGKLLVWRAAGSGSYTLVGKSATETFAPNTTEPPFDTRVPVQEGDRLGLRTVTDRVACFFSNFDESTSMDDVVGFQYSDGQPAPPDGGGGGSPSSACISESIANQTFEQETCQEEFCATFIDPLVPFDPTGEAEQCRSFEPSPANAADPEPGSTQSFDPVQGEGGRVNVSATIEPDADGDGFGDETQDLCPTDASTQGVCPPPQTDDDGQLPGPPPDFAAPELQLFGKLTQRFRKVVRVAAVCATERCDVVATGRLIVKPPARKRKRRRGAGRFLRTRGFKLGRATATLGAGEKAPLRLKIRRPAQKAANKALRQGGKVRAIVRVRAIDQAGNDAFDRRALNLQKKQRAGGRRAKVRRCKRQAETKRAKRRCIRAARRA